MLENRKGDIYKLGTLSLNRIKKVATVEVTLTIENTHYILFPQQNSVVLNTLNMGICQSTSGLFIPNVSTLSYRVVTDSRAETTEILGRN